MNHKPSGFLQYKSAEGLAPATMIGYEHDLNLWIGYQGDMDVGEIHSQHIVAFLSYLRTDYVPRPITGDNSRKLTPRQSTTSTQVWHPSLLGRVGNLSYPIQ